MTTFQIISDIHFEINRNIKDYITPNINNILIIAGDVGRVENLNNYSDIITWLCQQFNKVILVPGNHEYYTSNKYMTYTEVNKILIQLKQSLDNLLLLLDDHVVINDILIFGSTFWSYSPREYFVNIPIYDNDNKSLTCSSYNKFHINSQKALEMCIEFSYNNNLKMVVITHYAPTFNDTLDIKYRNFNDIKNYMYCSNCDHFLKNNIIKYWIYGHTGYNCSNNSKLISNQVNKNGFDKQKTIIL